MQQEPLAASRGEKRIATNVVFAAAVRRPEKRAAPQCSICLVPCAQGFHCPNAQCNVWTCYRSFAEALEHQPPGIQCVSCRTIWPEETWSDLFSPAFLRKKIRPKVRAQLFAQSLVRMPLYQEAARHSRAVTMLNEEIPPLEIELRRLNGMMEETRRLIDATRQLKAQKITQRQAHRVQVTLQLEMAAGAASSTMGVRRCLSSWCAGFLGSALHCSLCQQTFCEACQQPAHAPSPCLPAHVATVQYLLHETRPCPKCLTPIQKKEGCNDMWCIVPYCNTHFNYRTGNVTMPAHNPEHDEIALRGGLYHGPELFRILGELALKRDELVFSGPGTTLVLLNDLFQFNHALREISMKRLCYKHSYRWKDEAHSKRMLAWFLKTSSDPPLPEDERVLAQTRFEAAILRYDQYSRQHVAQSAIWSSTMLSGIALLRRALLPGYDQLQLVRQEALALAVSTNTQLQALPVFSESLKKEVVLFRVAGEENILSLRKGEERP